MTVINAAYGFEKTFRPIRYDLPDKDASEEQHDPVCRVIATDCITCSNQRDEE